MAEKQITIDPKEIYKILCPKCQKKLEELVAAEISKNIAKEVLKPTE